MSRTATLRSSSGIVYPQRGQWRVAHEPKESGQPCSLHVSPPGEYWRPHSGQVTGAATGAARGRVVSSSPRTRDPA